MIFGIKFSIFMSVSLSCSFYTLLYLPLSLTYLILSLYCPLYLFFCIFIWIYIIWIHIIFQEPIEILSTYICYTQPKSLKSNKIPALIPALITLLCINTIDIFFSLHCSLRVFSTILFSILDKIVNILHYFQSWNNWKYFIVVIVLLRLNCTLHCTIYVLLMLFFSYHFCWCYYNYYYYNKINCVFFFFSYFVLLLNKCRWV